MNMDLKTHAHESVSPLLVELAEPVRGNSSAEVTLGAMTKYKTFNGEEINGHKVWHYDYADDDV